MPPKAPEFQKLKAKLRKALGAVAWGIYSESLYEISRGGIHRQECRTQMEGLLQASPQVRVLHNDLALKINSAGDDEKNLPLAEVTEDDMNAALEYFKASSVKGRKDVSKEGVVAPDNEHPISVQGASQDEDMIDVDVPATDKPSTPTEQSFQVQARTFFRIDEDADDIMPDMSIHVDNHTTDGILDFPSTPSSLDSTMTIYPEPLTTPPRRSGITGRLRIGYAEEPVVAKASTPENNLSHMHRGFTREGGRDIHQPGATANKKNDEAPGLFAQLAAKDGPLTSGLFGNQPVAKAAAKDRPPHTGLFAQLAAKDGSLTTDLFGSQPAAKEESVRVGLFANLQPAEVESVRIGLFGNQPASKEEPVGLFANLQFAKDGPLSSGIFGNLQAAAPLKNKDASADVPIQEALSAGLQPDCPDTNSGQQHVGGLTGPSAAVEKAQADVADVEMGGADIAVPNNEVFQGPPQPNDLGVVGEPSNGEPVQAPGTIEGAKAHSADVVMGDTDEVRLSNMAQHEPFQPDQLEAVLNQPALVNLTESEAAAAVEEAYRDAMNLVAAGPQISRLLTNTPIHPELGTNAANEVTDLPAISNWRVVSLSDFMNENIAPQSPLRDSDLADQSHAAFYPYVANDVPFTASPAREDRLQQVHPTWSVTATVGVDGQVPAGNSEAGGSALRQFDRDTPPHTMGTLDFDMWKKDEEQRREEYFRHFLD